MMRQFFFYLCLIAYLPVYQSNSTTPHFIESHALKNITFIQINGSKEKKLLTEAKGAGVSVVDINQDGWDDIYFCNGLQSNIEDKAPKNKLFLNQKDGTFLDVTEDLGLALSGQSISTVFGDYDNDGDLDVYICKTSENLLLQNNNGIFEDMSQFAKVNHPGMSTAAAWGDVNNDGFLDLFVCNYADITLKIATKFGGMTQLMGQEVFLGPLTFKPQNDVLFINQKDGTFKDESSLRGIQTWEEGRGLGVRMLDSEQDGDLDIFVGNDMTSDSFYLNDGNGFFQEQSLLVGLGYNGNGLALATMGIAVGDYDNDLDQDILIAGYEGETNTLYRNEDGQYLDITVPSNAGTGSKPYVTFGALMGDWNNDGFADLFYANGHVYPAMDNVPNHPGYAQPNQILINNGNHQFQDVSVSSGPGLAIIKVSRGAATADFDHDGDLDIIVNNLDDVPSFLENQSQNSGYWLQILPVNKYGSPAYGTRMEVHCTNKIWQQTLYSTDSFCSQSSAWLHFGLGQESVQKLYIVWANGIKEEILFSGHNKRIMVKQQIDETSTISSSP